MNKRAITSMIAEGQSIPEAGTYDEPELGIGDTIGRVDPNRIDVGVLKQMLSGDDNSNRAFALGLDDEDYNSLEEDSVTPIGNELLKTRNIEKAKLRKEYENNKDSVSPSLELGEKYRASYENIMDVKEQELKDKYPKVQFDKHWARMGALDLLREAGASDNEIEFEIDKLRTKWQNREQGN